MAQDFFDLLYNGYTGEYQLMSSLYRNGLDALRPPADMGVDVVSLNLKQQLENPGTAPETFFFQVKTAVTNVSESAERPGAIATVEFKLKESEVDLLSRSRDRALFCYVYNSEADSLTDSFEAPFICFWLDGTLLETIRRAGAFFRKEGEPKLTLACQLRKPTHEFGHWYALVVDGEGSKVDGGYLGVVGGSGNPASDEADHYSVAGYLAYARDAATPAA
ncbi:hypothetical protein [uncultured Ellagibacter sp.]|uniref:hypothetical protein n=1 Tax=uncultured Ellagibacter sp. TaxID=2137580 RepID=UPI00260452F8|nr:hypothetical protein [uncultured Ellagibacter sp.]